MKFIIIYITNGINFIDHQASNSKFSICSGKASGDKEQIMPATGKVPGNVVLRSGFPISDFTRIKVYPI